MTSNINKKHKLQKVNLQKKKTYISFKTNDKNPIIVIPKIILEVIIKLCKIKAVLVNPPGTIPNKLTNKIKKTKNTKWEKYRNLCIQTII